MPNERRRIVVTTRRGSDRLARQIDGALTGVATTLEPASARGSSEELFAGGELGGVFAVGVCAAG